jgi:hypothetical protein
MEEIVAEASMEEAARTEWAVAAFMVEAAVMAEVAAVTAKH